MTPFTSHEKAIWKGSPQPYLGDLRSPWLLTTKPKCDDLPSSQHFSMNFNHVPSIWTGCMGRLMHGRHLQQSLHAAWIPYGVLTMSVGRFSRGWSPVFNNELTTGEKKQSCQKSGKHLSTSMFAAWRDVVDFCVMSVHGVYCTFIRITKWKSNLHVWNSFSRPSCWIVSS